jgi:hypothetical protein
MPFLPQSTYVRTDVHRCVACELPTGPGNEELEDEDDREIPLPPAGWLLVTIEQVVLNPDYAAEKAQRENDIRDAIAAVAKEKGKEPSEFLAHEMAQIRDSIEKIMGELEEREYEVHKAVVALCIQHAEPFLKDHLKAEPE